MSSRFSAALIAVVAVLLIAGSTQAAPIIFDDFNANQGHFGYAPTFSSTSNVSSASTNTYVTTGGGIDGGNFIRIQPVMSATTPARIRLLSGGPPYNTTNGGAPVGNVSFNVAAAQDDGKIGFYYRATTSGFTLAINLDQPTNTGGVMVGSVPKTVTAGLADGTWHFFEWNLDNLADWGAVAGIGGSNANLEGFNHTIDSIYIQGLTATNSAAPIDIDFLGKTNSSADSVSTLVPEPATLGLLAMLSPLVIRRRRMA